MHLHQIVGGVKTEEKFDNRDVPTAERHLVPGLVGDMCRSWLAITKDSFNVDVRPVAGPAGAANYIGKYLLKSVEERRELQRRGFVRRWSTSRNWPSPGPLQMRGTIDGKWAFKSWSGYGEADDLARFAMDRSEKYAVAERVGTDLALALAERSRRKKAFRELERMSGTFVALDKLGPV